jgi:hypothetical protein
MGVAKGPAAGREVLDLFRMPVPVCRPHGSLVRAAHFHERRVRLCRGRVPVSAVPLSVYDLAEQHGRSIYMCFPGADGDGWPVGRHWPFAAMEILRGS